MNKGIRFYVKGTLVEITKREILLSISIIAVMIGIGTLIDGAIVGHYNEKSQKIKHSVEINTADEFDYCMRTDVGDVIGEDILIATTPASIPDIPGTYMYICKEKQKYTMHTRVHHVSNGKSSSTYTTHYWSWDTVHKDKFYAGTLEFLGQTVNIKPNEWWSEKNCTIKESSHIRYIYYTIPTEIKGVLQATIVDRHLTNEVFHEGITVEQLNKQAESASGVIFFWIIWVLLTSFLVFLFYVGEYKWLERN